MRILLIEDDAMLGRATTEGLREQFTVDWFTTATEGTEAIASTGYDLIILDIGLPDASGTDILKQMRAQKNATPVMFLTAKDSIVHRVAGLNLGADDYVIKPFDLEELIARCHALTRRNQGHADSKITWQDITYDATARMVTQDAQPVHLSARELAVLDILMNNIGKIISKTQIETSMYHWQQDIESNTVEVHISSLRRKLGKDFINTIRGIGYTIHTPS